MILLLPGTMCHWKGNFDGVIDKLAEDFLAACVAYTGFDEGDKEDYRSVMDEVQRIEEEVQRRYGGTICAAYGCSLGGTFVAHLIHRHKIHMKAGIGRYITGKPRSMCSMRKRWAKSIWIDIKSIFKTLSAMNGIFVMKSF